MSKKKIVIGGAFAGASLVAITYILGKTLNVLGDDPFSEFDSNSEPLED